MKVRTDQWLGMARCKRAFLAPRLTVLRPSAGAGQAAEGGVTRAVELGGLSAEGQDPRCGISTVQRVKAETPAAVG
jgi:hypothetical protein